MCYSFIQAKITRRRRGELETLASEIEDLLGERLSKYKELGRQVRNN